MTVKCLCVTPVEDASRFAEQPIRVWALPDAVIPIAREHALDTLDFTLGIARITSKARAGIVGILSGETRTMFFMMNALVEPIGPITMGDGAQLEPNNSL